MNRVTRKAWRALGALALLVGAPSMAQATAQVIAVRLVMTDVQGTPVMKKDLQGNILARYDYRPYGAQQGGPVEAGPGYTGHVNDPQTGLVYMQARYYDPEVGRFLSVDPVGVRPGDGFGFNRYVYANGNPIVNIDPDGRQTAKTHPDDTPEERRRAMQERERRRAREASMDTIGRGVRSGVTSQDVKECADDDSCLVARAVGHRLLKMAAKGVFKKIAPSKLTSWITALSRGVVAAKRAKDWGMFFATTNELTFLAAKQDIDFYELSKSWAAVPLSPTVRQYQGSWINWGKMDWKPYDNSTQTLSGNEVWDNFVYDREESEYDEADGILCGPFSVLVSVRTFVSQGFSILQ